MTIRRPCAVFTLALLTVLTGRAADDSYGDPIPEGAKLRLGTARMRGGSVGSPTAITPDGKFLVAATSGGKFVFIEPSTGTIDHAVTIDGEYGTPFGFSADGKRGTGGGYQGWFVWDTENGKVLAKVKRSVASGDNGGSLSADGKRFAVGGNRNFNDKEKVPDAVVWNVDENKELASVKPAQNESIFVSLSADGKRLATWGNHYDREAKESPKPENDPSRVVQFWDAVTGKELAKTRILGGYAPVAVALTADGMLAAVSGADGAVRLIDTANGEQKGLLLGRSRVGRKLLFSPDNKTLAASGDDSSVQRWNVADGKRLGTTEAPLSSLFTPRVFQFIDNERLIIAATRGLAAVAWEVPPGKMLTPVGGNYNSITSAAVGGKEIITGGSDGAIIRWDATTGKELGTSTLKPPSGGYGYGPLSNPITLSPDGTRALASDSGGGIGVYDLPAGTQQFVLPGDTNRDSRGAFTPDSTKILQTMSSYDVKKNPTRATAWDIAGAKKLIEVELPGLTSVAAAFSPDAKTLITAGIKLDEKNNPTDFVVTGWDVATSKKRGEYTEPAGYGSVYVVAAGDNKSAVVYSPKTGPIVVDVFTGTKLRALDLGGKRPGVSPAISPDGKSVAVPLSPGFGTTPTTTVLLIDIETGKVKKTLAGISGSLSTVAFSPNGKTLITGSYDTTALVWDISKD